MQQHCRRNALAHVGISSSSQAPRSEQEIAELVKDWRHSYKTVLTKQQREV